MENTININNFKMSEIEPIVKAYGTVNENGIAEINTSSILTKLIQEVGTHCKSYASDLFIDWEELVIRMAKPNYTGEVMLFGIRELGVDHASFIFSRLEGLKEPEKAISEIYCGGLWILKISVNENKYNVTMELGKAEFIN